MSTDVESAPPVAKRKPGRPPGSLNKKTLEKRAAEAEKRAAECEVDKVAAPRTTRKTTSPRDDERSRARVRRPSTSSGEIVVRRRKKRRLVIEDSSDSSPSPVVVKRRPRPSAPPESPEPIETPAARGAHLERMLAQHAQYNAYFARLR